MNYSLPVTILVIIVLLVLVILIILKNKKDKKELEHKLKEDYEKPRHHEDDLDVNV